MSEPPPIPAPAGGALRGVLLALLVAAAAFALAAALMATSGALTSDFGAFEDEPSHLVGGLLVRDWLHQGLAEGTWGHPLRYAEQYYVHYPKVAIGQWPPGWPALEGLWMLAFGTSTLAVQLLLCTLVALTSMLVFVAVRGDAGDGCAALGALVYPCLPLVQRFGHMSMTEVPQALWVTAAVLCFGRWIDVGRARWVLLFALLAVASILTKGNGIFLALVPPGALLLSGRLDLWRRPALWVAALLVAALTAPWYWLTLSISRTTWGAGAEPSLEYVAAAAPAYARALAGLAGVVAGLMAVLGIATRLSTGPGGAGPRRGRWAALGAWMPALFLCVLVVPTGIDPRHLVLLAPAWLAAWAVGTAWVARRAGWPTLVPLLLAGTFAIEAFHRPRKDSRGYTEAARSLLADGSLARSAFLVASDSKGEGAFVAGVALHEERPGHVVLRASKVLGSSDWMGRDYAARFADGEELAAFLAELPVGVVALDRVTQRHHWFAHHDQLAALLASRPEVWQPAGRFDVVRDGVRFPGALELYRQVGHEERPLVEIDLDLVLGRKLPGF